MTVCVVFLVLAGCVAPAPGVVDPHAAITQDAWVAEDKLRHFTLSAAATAMGYGTARVALEHEPAVLAAGASALSLGVAKEIRDARGGGFFSLKDLAWDAAGVALGVVLASGIR